MRNVARIYWLPFIISPAHQVVSPVFLSPGTVLEMLYVNFFLFCHYRKQHLYVYAEKAALRMVTSDPKHVRFPSLQVGGRGSVGVYQWRHTRRWVRELLRSQTRCTPANRTRCASSTSGSDAQCEAQEKITLLDSKLNWTSPSWIIGCLFPLISLDV